MRDVLPTLKRWLEEGHRFSLATVTHTWGSSPRPVGSVMGVREDGLIVGSVSGGCVENAVIEEALNALKTGKPKMLEFAGLSDVNFWDVGLSCGGKIRVLVEPPIHEEPVWQELVSNLDAERPCLMMTWLEPYGHELWHPGHSCPKAAEVYATKQSLEEEGVFYRVYPPQDRLLIVGAVHIAIPVVKFAKELGFEVVVIDPRSTFASSERFPLEPDQFVVDWPDRALSSMPLTESTYAVVLTHDPKIDDVALRLLLRSEVAYIGALGSRTTQEKRRRELLESGFTEEELSRIHGPVGLAIKARTPEEIALSIMAEIVQVKRASQ